MGAIHRQDGGAGAGMSEPARNTSHVNKGPIGARAVRMARAGERRHQVLELRIRGLSFHKIGKALGISHVQAWNDYQRVMRDLHALEIEKGTQLRDIETRRLDHMLAKLEPGIDAGDAQAIQAALAISKRRAALWGLDAPAKLEHSGPDGKPIEKRIIIEWGESIKVIDAQLVGSNLLDGPR